MGIALLEDMVKNGELPYDVRRRLFRNLQAGMVLEVEDALHKQGKDCYLAVYEFGTHAAFRNKFGQEYPAATEESVCVRLFNGAPTIWLGTMHVDVYANEKNFVCEGSASKRVFDEMTVPGELVHEARSRPTNWPGLYRLSVYHHPAEGDTGNNEYFQCWERNGPL